MLGHGAWFPCPSTHWLGCATPCCTTRTVAATIAVPLPCCRRRVASFAAMWWAGHQWWPQVDTDVASPSTYHQRTRRATSRRYSRDTHCGRVSSSGRSISWKRCTCFGRLVELRGRNCWQSSGVHSGTNVAQHCAGLCLHLPVCVCVMMLCTAANAIAYFDSHRTHSCLLPQATHQAAAACAV